MSKQTAKPAAVSSRPRRASTDKEARSRVRQVETAIQSGRTVASACETARVAVPTYYRWQRRFKGRAEGADSQVDSRSAIIAAAKKLFFERGLDATLEDVAAEANMARQTLYNQFGSKQNLFREVVMEVHAGLMSGANMIREGLDLRATLYEYGRALIRLLLDKEAIALSKIAIAEFRRLPDLGRISFELRETEALPRLTAKLAAYLRQSMTKSASRQTDPDLLAEIFYGAVLGYDRHRLLSGVEAASPDRIERRIALAVDIVVLRLTSS